MEDLEFKELVQRALNMTYFFLKFRPRTKKEVVDYLKKKADRHHWPPKIVDSALLDLEKQGLVNDKEFVEWFVRQRSQTKPKSQFALRSELIRLGISKELVEKHFSETPIEEESLALQALQRKWNQFERLDKRTRFQKAVAYLSRRGFSFDKTKQAIKTLEEGTS